MLRLDEMTWFVFQPLVSSRIKNKYCKTYFISISLLFETLNFYRRCEIHIRLCFYTHGKRVSFALTLAFSYCCADEIAYISRSL